MSSMVQCFRYVERTYSTAAALLDASESVLGRGFIADASSPLFNTVTSVKKMSLEYGSGWIWWDAQRHFRKGANFVGLCTLFYDPYHPEREHSLCIASAFSTTQKKPDNLYALVLSLIWRDQYPDFGKVYETGLADLSHKHSYWSEFWSSDVVGEKIRSIAVPLEGVTSPAEVEKQLFEPLLGKP